MNQVHEKLINLGYEKLQYCYRCTVKSDEGAAVSHYVTPFGDQKYQVWAAYDLEGDERIYDTGIIPMSEEELFLIINILSRNSC